MAYQTVEHDDRQARGRGDGAARRAFRRTNQQ
jgi:hypothetical protein